MGDTIKKFHENEQKFYMDEENYIQETPRQEIITLLEELILDKDLSLEHTSKVARIRTLMTQL